MLCMNCRKNKKFIGSHWQNKIFYTVSLCLSLSHSPKLFFFFFFKVNVEFSRTFLSSLYQQQNIISYIHRMLSARPVLRNAVRSASVAARSSARVVCITHILTNSMDWNKGWKRIFSIRRNQSLIHHQLRC